MTKPGIKTVRKRGPKGGPTKEQTLRSSPPTPKVGEALGEFAYRILRDALRSGRFEPGASLREAEVATWLQVSRTPVREAFRRIISEGLLVVGTWNGATVAELSSQQLVELYTVRAALEGTAASLAAQHASLAEIQNLFAIAEREEKSRKDSAGLVLINAELHQAIYSAAHNRYLLQSLNSIVDTLGLLRHSTYVLPGSIERAHREHLDILDAISKRNAPLAQELAIRHTNHALETRLQITHHKAAS